MRQVREAEGVQRLEALKGYVDSGIKEQASDILDNYLQKGETIGAVGDSDSTSDEDSDEESDSEAADG